MGQKHGEWLKRPRQDCRPDLDACVESLASTGLPLSATLTCGKPQGKRLWDKSLQAENGHGSATHSGDQVTALPDKLFFGTRREVDRERDSATAGGETQTISSSREVFPGISWTPVQGQRGLEGLCQWPFRDGIIKNFRSDRDFIVCYWTLVLIWDSLL